MLTDQFGRRFAYLRLSITNACNFSCQYCLPKGYQAPSAGPAFLRLDEIKQLVAGFVDLGMVKVRLTGGEPTIRRDFLAIAEHIASYPSINTLALTTNGYRLTERVGDYRRAGINHLNVSIDSLNAESFRAVSGKGSLNNILKGIDLALGMNFKAVKVNSVLLRGINDQALDQFAAWIKDRPLSLRFIELMPTCDNGTFFRTHHMRAMVLKEQLLEQGWEEQAPRDYDGPAKVLTHPQYQGTFGFIAAYDRHFCQGCNRLRVTAQGELRLCLFGNGNYSLRPYLQQPEQKEALKQKVLELLAHKEESHRLQEGHYGATRNFAAIGG